jgi:hypothetical protein
LRSALCSDARQRINHANPPFEVRRAFARVILISGDTQPVETREFVLQCGNLAVHVNPITGIAYSGPSKGPARSRASVDTHFIVIEATAGKMRTDRDTGGYSLMSYKDEPKGGGTCKLMP